MIGKRAVTEIGGNKSRRKDRDKWYIIPDHHSAIVDKETFDKSQEKQYRFTIPKKQQRIHPLKGKVLCENCRHVLSRVSQTNQ